LGGEADEKRKPKSLWRYLRRRFWCMPISRGYRPVLAGGGGPLTCCPRGRGNLKGVGGICGLRTSTARVTIDVKRSHRRQVGHLVVLPTLRTFEGGNVRYTVIPPEMHRRRDCAQQPVSYELHNSCYYGKSNALGMRKQLNNEEQQSAPTTRRTSYGLW
jgi:hypothetical protein